MLKPNDVFTPGKLPIRPTNVYAARGDAEKLFLKTLDRGLIPVVFGEYGVGKTSMARYALREKDAAGLLINIESAADRSFEDVFARCLETLGYTVRTKVIESRTQSSAHEQSAQAEAGVGGWLKAVVASKKTASNATSQQSEEQLVVTSPTDSKIIDICEKNGVVLLIDELHRASTSFTSDLAKFIKTYGNANCHEFKVILLGTSSDVSRLVASDPGIDRLIQEVHLKAMTEHESLSVIQKGMNDLAIALESPVAERVVRTSVGSPSILQYLSLEVAEEAFPNTPRVALNEYVDNALKAFVETKEARLYKSYLAAVESTGELRYRKQILRAMAECEDEYVTMEIIRTKVGQYLGKEIESNMLSSPLRSLKEDRYGPVLSDVERPDSGRLSNFTTFKDPALKAFIRLQLLRESDQA